MEEVAIWILIWFLVFGVWNGFFKWFLERLSYKKFIPRGLYFLLSFAIVYYKYENLIILHLSQLIIGFLIANFVGTLLSLNRNFYREFVKSRFFILFQSFNILFQQAMIISSIVILKNYLGIQYSHYFYGLFFTIVHLPILFFRKFKLRYLILIYCIFGGFMFSYLILNHPLGIILSFLLHFSLYIWMIYFLEDDRKM